MVAKRAGVSRADLLRVLRVSRMLPAGATQEDELAQRMHFSLPRQVAGEASAKVSVTINAKAQVMRTEGLQAQVQQGREKLRAPHFALLALEVLPHSTSAPAAGENAQPENVQPKNAQPPMSPLSDSDFEPRQTGELPPCFLLPDAALSQRIHRQLRQTDSGARPDLPKLLHLAARAKWPLNLPRRTESHAPSEVWLIADRSQHLRPYWDDQEHLLCILRRWLGPQALSALSVQGDPWHVCAAWVKGQVLQEMPDLPAPKAGSLVLVLSDMGCLQQGVSNQTNLRNWQQAVREMGRNGAQVFAVPLCSPALLPAAWTTPLRLLPVEAPAVLHPGVGRQALPGNAHDFSVELKTVPWQELSALNMLLVLLSCARRIEPELLRALRRLHPPCAREPGLEAQVWSCHHVLSIGYDVCVWQPEQAPPYRQKFAGLPAPLQQAVLRTMLRIHAWRGRAIEVQEILVWASHTSAEARAGFEMEVEAAEQWLQRLPLGHDIARASPGLVAFAGQQFDFHRADPTVLASFDEAFGPLWAIADVAARQNGEAAPDPGALPLRKLNQWRGRAQKVHTWHLFQQGSSLRVSAEAGGARSSCFGMPLSSSHLLLHRLDESGRAQLYANLSQPEFELPLGKEDLWQVQTDDLRLTLGPITPPFPATETGRDRYGLYADLEIMGIIQRMRYIPPGEFLMGSPKTEAGRFDDEGPQHLVRITQGFWLADTACTQALWHALMGDNPAHFNENNKGGPQHPVERVNWLMVQEFLSKLSTHLPGAVASLPTEAEWEYACRAGTDTPFSFGENISTEQVNYDGSRPYGKGKKGQYRKKTVPAPSFPANAWGLYQMHGNVWEWCADESRHYDQEAVIDPGLAQALAPLPKPQEGMGRVLRGGSWLVNAHRARSASRLASAARHRNGIIGFRLALRFPAA